MTITIGAVVVVIMVIIVMISHPHQILQIAFCLSTVAVIIIAIIDCCIVAISYITIMDK